ncbi:MAG: sulfoxide reductase heme-binding subunit YedZ [Bryobacterales bacterium]|nr:sulfoxide reductase heme-binding subunit YedZ [Bryobacterales bacterium]
MLRARWVKVALFLLCLVPLAWLAYRWQTNQLGFNRAETVARYTGDWTLRMLLFSLTVTPLRRMTGWNDLIRFRRMLGLFAFFYGTLHLFHYLWMDKAWFWPEIWDDLKVRRFFSMGWAAWAMMLPLALTSTAAAIRALGKKWQLLHRLAYASAIAGVVHFYWQGKAALWDPILYGVAVFVLLALRLWFARKKWLALFTDRPKVAPSA